MKAFFPLMLFSFGLINSSMGAELHPGELHHTASTMASGRAALHALPSAWMYGISDRVDIKTNVIGMATGLNASGEFQVWNKPGHTISLEPRF